MKSSPTFTAVTCASPLVHLKVIRKIGCINRIKDSTKLEFSSCHFLTLKHAAHSYIKHFFFLDEDVTSMDPMGLVHVPC